VHAQEKHCLIFWARSHARLARTIQPDPLLSLLSLSLSLSLRYVAKKRWTTAGAKVKLAAALMGGIGMLAEQHKEGGEGGSEAEKSKRHLEEEQAVSEENREKPVANHLLGCSYAAGFTEALMWAGVNGKKLWEFFEEAQEEAEVIMERMREQSLLTDVSEQMLIRNNITAKCLSKVEIMDKVFERAIRTCEMPPIPGAEDESKWHLLTRMASLSQLKEDMVDEDGEMVFKKLDMSGQKHILAFILQRSWEKLLVIVREGEFNAASTIQVRREVGVGRS
jgi:hypothetical protein